ncbi:MAG: asparaginase domain-containing protein [Methylomonas sp.]|nr:asparaginase domain-containing protein [Methylomonas sp.]
MTDILLVFTGGTIGSQLAGDTIDTDESAGFKLISLFRKFDTGQDRINFKTLQPVQILSENLHPSVWYDMISAIEAEELSRYDGVIVTHGTDTLAYTAAIFGLYFSGLDIPMLLVSSDLPLDNPAANGLKNFLCAVEYIRQRKKPGVFVPYRNPGMAMHIHIATRLSSCLPLSSDFISVQNKVYQTFENGEFVQHHERLPVRVRRHRLKPRFGKILLIRPYPGLDYDHFNLDEIDAVLHDLYHSGTACVSERWGMRHNLIAFSRRCQRRNIPLYLAPAVRSDAAYSSTKALLAHGAKMIWNISLETVYAKLALAYGNFDDDNDIAAFIEQDIADEHV